MNCSKERILVKASKVPLSGGYQLLTEQCVYVRLFLVNKCRCNIRQAKHYNCQQAQNYECFINPCHQTLQSNEETISTHNLLIRHNTVKPQDTVLTILLHAKRDLSAVLLYVKAVKNVKNMTSFIFHTISELS